jgi:hypothetical protein
MEFITAGQAHENFQPVALFAHARCACPPSSTGAWLRRRHRDRQPVSAECGEYETHR